MSVFQKATKHQTRARVGLIGPAGSGKTFTALRIARTLAGPAGRVAVIDTERGSASKYAGDANPDGGVFTFDVLELQSFHPDKFIGALAAAEAEGFDVAIIDSLSHAWMGKDGILQQVDDITKRSKSNSSFGAWRDATPMHHALVDALLNSRCHVIVTMRVKTEYVIEKDEKTGRTAPRKVGLAPVQRDGLEYEFDVVGDLDDNNTLVITKTRCSALANAVVQHPGGEFAGVIRDWLTDGAPAPAPLAQAPAASGNVAQRAGAAAPSTGSKPSDVVAASWRTFFETAQVSEFTPAAKDRLAADFSGTVPVEQRRAWYAALETRWLEQLQALEPQEVPELRERVTKQFSPNAVPPAIITLLDSAAKAGGKKAPDDDPLPEWAEPKGEAAAAAGGSDKAKDEKPKRARRSRKAAAEPTS